MRLPPRTSSGELPHRVREALSTLRQRGREWFAEVRANPAGLLQAPPVRIGLLLLGGLALVLAAQWLARGLAPPGSAAAAKYEPTAILYVACANPACRHASTVERPLDFAHWPQRCEKCGQPNVFRAEQCATCRKWFATAPGQPRACPHCIVPEQKPAAQSPPTPVKGDDAEDPW